MLHSVLIDSAPPVYYYVHRINSHHTNAHRACRFNQTSLHLIYNIHHGAVRRDKIFVIYKEKTWKIYSIVCALVFIENNTAKYIFFLLVDGQGYNGLRRVHI